MIIHPDSVPGQPCGATGISRSGYDLWAAHSSVPAAAHYDLAHSPVKHTVSALLLVWDGSELLVDDAGELVRR